MNNLVNKQVLVTGGAGFKKSEIEFKSLPADGPKRRSPNINA